MKNGKLSITDHRVVSLAYVLQLDDGEVVDQAPAAQPLEYLQGCDNIIPGLEKALDGMSAGDYKEVVVLPAEGYGTHQPDNVIQVPRYVFSADAELVEGELVEMGDRRTGEASMAKVLHIEPDRVLLDLNHPLAGETLHFRVEIVDVREATTEELTRGYVENKAYAYA